jgi:NAD(P)-dependent dehydrogenase (short-subunit alcohol dehydrogenase family)
MYNASKAAVNAIAYTLELELSPFDVKVITVMTGSVRTGYFDNQPPAILPKGMLLILFFNSNEFNTIQAPFICQ